MEQKSRKKFNLAFFASHNGSNMQSIIDACKSGYLASSPALVISNNSKSGALERAKNENIANFHISTKTHPLDNERNEAFINLFKKYEIDIVILAGYMRKFPNELIDFLSGRVLNIHPALLPKFGGENMYGMNVHKAVIEAKEKISGATVHLVSSEYDKGRILLQGEVPIVDRDTPETLASRVLEIEHKIYTETIRLLELGEIII